MRFLRSLIARSPRRALALGKGLFLAGAILILAAVFARAAPVPLPPWLVLQGPVGYVVAAILVLIGMALTVLAEKSLKDERHKRGEWW